MNQEQLLQYKQSLDKAAHKQSGVCFEIRKSIKRQQEKLTLELAILEDIHTEIDGLGNVV